MPKKTKSQLSPLVIVSEIPTQVPIPVESISSIELLFRRRGAKGEPFLTTLVDDWSLVEGATNVLTTTWFDNDDEIPPGEWAVLIRITAIDNRTLIIPDEGRIILTVEPIFE
jgi:hypothetical protein